MLAYYNVQFFFFFLQGACDSLAYEMKDSTLTMFDSPIVWTNKDQLTGDTIRILLSENKPKEMYLMNRAFIASKGYYEGHYNQVKGVEVTGFFNDSSELERINVYENVETIYFVTDDADSSLMGILKVKSEQMEILLEHQSIVSINYFHPEEDGAMYPETELPTQDRYLRGFLWQTDRRPKSKFDIWPQALKALMQMGFEDFEMQRKIDFGE
jgi:hypothetical protein